MGDTAITDDAEPQDAPLSDRPYRGLRYYTEADAKWFFGRTTERNVIIAHLRTARLTLLYAESGVGKSSVLRAGVAARLNEVATESVTEGEPPEFIPIVFTQWKDDPVKYLIAEIENQASFWANELGASDGSPPQSPTALARQTDRQDLAASINTAAEPLGTTFLIILDQFEELFGHPMHQEQLADELAGCIRSPGVSANFLVALREDAYGRVGELFDGRIRNVYGNYLHLEYLTPAAAREAIERPVDVYNTMHLPADRVELEPALTEAVLGSVAVDQLSLSSGGDDRAGVNSSTPNGRGIEAPFLQLVMERVWDSEIEHGSRALREHTLGQLGGAEAIVRGHLDRALGDLSSEEELAAATDVFFDLVAPSGAKNLYTARDLAVRHPQHRLATVAAVLAKLDMQRIVRETDPAPGGEDPRYEIYHDRLAQPILAWGRMQRDARLEKEKRDAELEAEAQRAQLRRFRRRTYSVAAVAAICLVVLATVALLLYAYSERQAALNQSRTARVLGLGVVAQQNLSSRPDVGLSFALAAYRIRPLSAESTMINALEGFRRAGAGAILHGHSDTVNTVAFSPDGRMLATGSSDKTIRLWNVRTREQIGRPLVRPGTTGVVSVAFSPDGQLLASAGGFDRTIRLWDVRTHSQIGGPLIADKTYFYSVAFSPDGRTLASAGYDTGIVLWDVSRHREVARLPCGCKAETSVAFSPNGRTLASAGYDGAIRLWDLVRRRQIARIAGRTGRIYAIAFSPDGRTVAYAGTRGTIGLLPANAHGHPGVLLRGHSRSVTSLAFRTSGELASASADSTVRLWNVVTHRELGAPLVGHAGTVLGVAFSPDGRTLASAGIDGTVRLWDAIAHRHLGEPLPGDLGVAYSVAISSDGRIVAAGGGNGDVRLWRTDTGAELAVLRTAEGGLVRSVAFSPDGHIVAAASSDGDVTMWNVASGQILATLAGQQIPVNAIAFSPDGRTLAAGGAHGYLALLDVRTHAVTHLSTGPSYVHAVAFNRTGMLLIASGGTVEMWDPGRRVVVRRLPVSNAPVNALALSTDGRMLATAGDDKIVHVWDLQTGGGLGTLSGSTGAIYGLAFSPDGRTLASGGADNLVRLWDIRTLTELGQPFPDHQNTVYSVAFSPDARTLFSGGGDGTVRVWSGIFWRDLAGLKQMICGLIGTGLSRPEWARYAHGLPFASSC